MDTMESTPSASYSVTLRVEFPHQPGSLGKILTAVGEVGGMVGAVDIVRTGGEQSTRDLTVNARDPEHARQIADTIDALPEVRVTDFSDRTFLFHLGGKIEVKSKTPVRTRDDLSMAYTPGVARLSRALPEAPARALTMAYHRHYRVGIRIVRIFNTYGPRMREDDGRMVPNFVRQALLGGPLSVYGDGTQTRSLQYVDDLIEGVILLMRSDETRPVNIGNPVEYTVREVAETVIELSGSRSEISHRPLPEDDPRQRRPDITRARESLGWAPRTQPRDGLEKTLSYFAQLPRGRAHLEAPP